MSTHKHRHDPDSRRKRFADTAPHRKWSWNAIIVAAAALFLGVAILTFARSSSGVSVAAPVVEAIEAGADFARSSALFADGQARFFQYRAAGGRNVSFFVMKSSDGIVRAAADACMVCYRERKGYHQEGDVMVCNNCNKSFRSVDINVITGGCNPIPLDRAIEGDRIVVRASALEQAATYF